MKTRGADGNIEYSTEKKKFIKHEITVAQWKTDIFTNRLDPCQVFFTSGAFESLKEFLATELELASRAATYEDNIVALHQWQGQCQAYRAMLVDLEEIKNKLVK